MFDASHEQETIEQDSQTVEVQHTFRPSKYQASYIWWLGFNAGLIGKTAPEFRKGYGSREKCTYECLVPDAVAVAEINKAIAWAMPPITTETWKGICKRYKHEPSPYQPPSETSKTQTMGHSTDLGILIPQVVDFNTLF
jgi:hypothetical protein